MLTEDADISLDYLVEIESDRRKKSFSLAVLGRIADTLKVDITHMNFNTKEFEKEETKKTTHKELMFDMVLMPYFFLILHNHNHNFYNKY